MKRIAALAVSAGLMFVGVSATAAADQSPITFYPLPGPTAGNLPLSESARVGGFLYLSGQIGNTQPGVAVVSGGVVPEARQVMDNIQKSLAARRLTMSDVFKCDVMLTDISTAADFNSVYQQYFKPGSFPARSAMGVTGLAFGAHVEVECIAVYPGYSR
ncbi:MAG: RidA family protein [Amycolatopsis sp.]|jgi:2-iminobutanoate/2-iminopropanoate deaminase|uniref:RidA family protein n=1 Tax=Amycolatopsis sp. TaxID=37632 RepID=UPI0026023A66|nr:RidA family protein [Amycolatopsis sp.]MCU1688031.1 RidA family protein [Amycolatopsis sp.]